MHGIVNKYYIILKHFENETIYIVILFIININNKKYMMIKLKKKEREEESNELLNYSSYFV